MISPAISATTGIQHADADCLACQGTLFSNVASKDSQ